MSDTYLLREALRLFWTVADRYVKTRLLWAFVLVGGVSLLVSLTPLALKLAMDSLTVRGASGALLAPAALIATYVLSQYFVRAFTELRVLTHGQAGQRMRRHIGQRLFEHVVRLPLRMHLDRRAGAVGETAEQGVRGYELLLEHTVYTILPMCIEFVIVAVVLVRLDHVVYLGMLGVAALAYAAAFRRGVRDFDESSRVITASHIELHSVLTDVLMNAETVKYFDAESTVSGRFGTVMRDTESAWRRFFRQRAVNGILVATIFATSLGVALLHASGEVASGVMTAGDFVLINAYVVRLVTPLEMLGFAFRDIAQGLAFLQKLLELFRETPEATLAPSAVVPTEITGELRFDDVSFSYRKDHPILRNVSFRVPAGRTIAVVGASGSGKSSLIRMLFRLYEPDSGRILLDGIPIASMPLRALRGAIAVVPQDTVLFHDTLLNNIGFGRAGATREDIEQAARVAHLHDLIVTLPDGYDTMVGERGLKLSGGERQRVAIARAVLKHPRIFVFDEATSSLDSQMEREILRNFLDVSLRSTTVMVAHRLSTIVHADEILVLDHGVVVERGSHGTLLELNGRYTALWLAQQMEGIHHDLPARRLRKHDTAGSVIS